MQRAHAALNALSVMAPMIPWGSLTRGLAVVGYAIQATPRGTPDRDAIRYRLHALLERTVDRIDYDPDASPHELIKVAIRRAREEDQSIVEPWRDTRTGATVRGKVPRDS